MSEGGGPGEQWAGGLASFKVAGAAAGKRTPGRKRRSNARAGVHPESVGLLAAGGY